VPLPLFGARGYGAVPGLMATPVLVIHAAARPCSPGASRAGAGGPRAWRSWPDPRRRGSPWSRCRDAHERQRAVAVDADARPALAGARSHAGERRRDKGLVDRTSVLSPAALPSLFAVLPPGTELVGVGRVRTAVIGYNTAEASSNMLRIAIATVEAFARGECLHVVNGV
jgi:hypothetical protein